MSNNNSDIEQRIADSWDQNIELRIKDLENSTDYSYINIIQPWIKETINRICTKNQRILDIGCGCGFLTNSIYAQNFTNIIGIDISNKSILMAKNMYPHIDFSVQNIYTYDPIEKFDLCIAVMVAHNLPYLDQFCKKLFHILVDGGRILLIIPHPYFWPQKHLPPNSLLYLREEKYTFRFSTKGQRNYPSDVHYFHRPLDRYYNCFTENGFSILRMKELPEEKINDQPDMIGIIIKKI